MAKRRLRHLVDDEGIVHFEGAAVAVNLALCGNNDATEETDEDVDCRACIAVLDHVYSHQKEIV